MKKLSIIILALTIYSCQTKTIGKEQIIETRLDSLLNSIYQKHPNGIGYILHVEAPDKNISWGNAVGYSDRITKDTLHKDQPGQIASITKMYVSAAIFRLIEQKKLDLLQPIKNLIPERTSDLLNEYGYNLDSISIAHLLSHRSGLPDNATKRYNDKEVNDYGYRWSRDELISDAVSGLKKRELGKFHYSDVNYYILSEIIEEIEKTSFYLAMRELLKFKENDLTHTWFYTLEPYPKDTKERFHQYKETRNWLSTFDESTTWSLYGNAGIYTTAEELAKFLQYLSSNKIFDNEETLELMFTQLGKDISMLDMENATNEELEAHAYRMGIFLIEDPNLTSYGHDGYWGSIVGHFPEENITFALFGLNPDEQIDIEKLLFDILNTLK